MTQSGIKLFNFQKSPVILKWWFFLFFAFLTPTQVLILFFSILLHEMGHAFMANKQGYGVKEIGVDMFFGSCVFSSPYIHERDSIKITLAGPMANLLLCAISFPFYYLNMGDIFQQIFNLNATLFLINLVPIYPLDGGSILRDILIIKIRRKAIEISAKISLSISVISAGILFYHGYLIGGFFALYFGYLALKELKYI